MYHVHEVEELITIACRVGKDQMGAAGVILSKLKSGGYFKKGERG